jgi:ATP-dependent DNA ligase
VLYAFDLLWRDGDLRQLPQIKRKQTLSDLLGENDIEAPIVYSEHLTGDGQEMFEHAAKLGWEGIVSKNAQAPYRSDRSEAWLKIKTVQKGQFPGIGFVKDPTGVAALYLGKQEGKDLVYIGKVGTGWSGRGRIPGHYVGRSASPKLFQRSHKRNPPQLIALLGRRPQNNAALCCSWQISAPLFSRRV